MTKPLDSQPILNAIASRLNTKESMKCAFSKLLVYFPETSKGSLDEYLDAELLREKFVIANEEDAPRQHVAIESVRVLYVVIVIITYRGYVAEPSLFNNRLETSSI